MTETPHIPADLRACTGRFNIWKSLAILPLAASLAGCGMFSSPPPPEPAPLGPVEAFLSQGNIGDRTRLDDHAFGKDVEVALDAVFTSANGEDCRRGTVLAARKDSETVVVCKDADGRWKMAPRIMGQRLQPE
ncbi:MAG: hypothetical protein LBR22_05910 [Desulfovibrio sp.]|jgi:hypothetical protein|nr:hypothetical protein [Desulfovibrio sp.]